MGELPFDKVIGGHGAVHHNRERLGQQRAYFEELIEIVLRAKEQGVPLDRLQQTITPGTLKSLENSGYGDDLASEIKKHDFRAHLSTHGEVLIRGVRDNVTAVFRNIDR